MRLQFLVSFFMNKSNPKFLLLIDFENPSSNPLKRPKSGDFDTKNAYRKPLVIL